MSFASGGYLGSRTAPHIAKSDLRRPCLSGLCLTRLVCAGMLALAPIAEAQAAPAPPLALRAITSAGEAHSLTSAQAALALPVHLSGVVTCVDPATPYGHSAFILYDSTGTIYVLFPEKYNGMFSAGSVVDVIGVSGAGKFAPVVWSSQVRVIGHSHLPENPPLKDLIHLKTGSEDGKWVEIEGTIRAAFEHDRYVIVELAMLGGSVDVTMPREAGVDYQRLVDAKVRIRGNAVPLMNANDQFVGVHLLSPGLSVLKMIEKPPSGDPFQLPVTPIDKLLRWDQVSAPLHRIHLRGQVTLVRPGSLVCIHDAARGVCAQTSQNTQFNIGDLVDAIGFPETENGGAALKDAAFKSSGQSTAVAVKAMTAGEVLQGRNDSDLIQVEGQLIASDLATSGDTLLLESGNVAFSAIVPKDLAASPGAKWKIGSTLRITGICSLRVENERGRVVFGEAPVATTFRVLMRSPQDAIVLSRPSWWTTGSALVALGILLVAVIAALTWIARLRHRVRVQTAALKKAQEEAAAINELAHAMQEVTAKRRLTGRVSATGSEQIAQLGIGFNRMLAELEQGEQATRLAEAKLQRLALTDELTGLPNRRAFLEQLTQNLALAGREELILAVLFIDLDGFKAVNDRLGHAAGDLLLQEVSKRLRSRIREADTLARLGGDEFTIMLTGLQAARDAEAVAGKLLGVLSERIMIESHEVSIGASIGICLCPRDGVDAELLMKNADSAMYEAKNRGKNQVRCFDLEMGTSEQERLGLEGELLGAIARGEIHLHYQPEFDLSSARLTRFEALARWTHPVLGSISPNKFIPVADRSGQSVALGAYVLQQACVEARKWQDLSPNPIQVAVNVSGLQFMRDTFVDEVAQILAITGLSPELLQIELTESVILTREERTEATMKRFKALGVTLAIDDFGTRYSCLSRLPKLPFDMMKIDRSFMSDLCTSAPMRATVSFLISLAHSLNMQVVVAGVETAEQLKIVQLMNGTEIQGFLVGRPTADPQSLLRSPRGAMMNLDAGISVEETTEVFDATPEEVGAVLRFASESLATVPALE